MLPISVERQPASDASRNRDLAVQVSFDDGKTWRKVLVVKVPGGGLAFRAQATDTSGNTAEVTVIRAYQIAPRR